MGAWRLLPGSGHCTHGEASGEAVPSGSEATMTATAVASRAESPTIASRGTTPLEFRGLRIDTEVQEVVVDTKVVDLTRLEFDQPRTATAIPLARTLVAGRGSVLLAEDNVINRKVATAMLESGGYSVDIAVDGKEALRAVRAGRYDVVLIDYQMPQMDGYEATATICAKEGSGRRLPSSP